MSLIVQEQNSNVTPSMREDFRLWRMTTKPEDLPMVELWIAAMLALLEATK